MAVGRISTCVLTDIANAIRKQAGVSTLYKPGDMAAAITALDGSDAGRYQAQPCMELESGVLSRRVFEDIADAIRGQNGVGQVYRPEEMATAILALEWDVGFKVRALFLSDGTLEFNYYEWRRTVHGGTVLQVFEVDPAGYASAGARPWDGIKLLVKKVYIDGSIGLLGLTNCAYWFNAFSECAEVWGFENLSAMTNATQMFANCAALESIYATSFTNGITNSGSMFFGCSRLVGGEGFVPSSTSMGSVCKLGAGGVLTDPSNDSRIWFYAHFYEDGEAVLTASPEPDTSRALLASGRICANARYQGLGFAPWEGTNRALLTSASFAADMAGYSHLNLNYLFYSCTGLKSVSGLGNLSGVRSMRFAFSSCGLSELDFRGFDPSLLTDLYCCFSGCGALTTIYADAAWELPSSGLSGSQCFYNCPALVGGNGTVWSGSNTGCAYMRIDRAGTPGYLTST